MKSTCNIHTFVSYKGGTGRTVTCANIAYQLARFGMKVLVADLDIDGPGMGELALIDKKQLQQKGVIQYLAASGECSPKEYIITKKFTKGSGSVDMDFMVAPMSFDVKAALQTHGAHLQDKMDRFSRELRELYDVILIDSASGISDYSALAFAVSDYITVCFRWSRQHVLGTVNLIHLLKGLAESDRFFLKRFFLLANAVPVPKNYQEQDIRDEVLETLSSISMKDSSMSVDNSKHSIISIITESDDQKWQEQIITRPSPLFSEYERYAKVILNEEGISF